MRAGYENNNNLLIDMPVPSAFFKLVIPAFAALVSMAGAPKASIFMGKGNNEYTEKVMGSCTWLLIILSVVLTGIFTSDATLITYTNKSMRVYLAMLFIYGIQVACQYSFVALDQAPKAIFLTIWRKIIILIPLIFILPQFVPNAVMGVYLAEPIFFYAVYIASPFVIPDSIFALVNVSCIINVTVRNIFIFFNPLIVCFSN